MYSLHGRRFDSTQPPFVPQRQHGDAAPPSHTRARRPRVRDEEARPRRREVARAQEVTIQATHHHVRLPAGRDRDLRLRQALAALAPPVTSRDATPARPTRARTERIRLREFPPSTTKT